LKRDRIVIQELIRIDTTMLDLPKALEAQTDALKAMTAMLLEMKTDRNDPYEPGFEIEEENEQRDDPMGELMSAAQNIIAESHESVDNEEAQGEEVVSDAVRKILEQTSPTTDFAENLQEIVSSSFSKITNPTSITLFEELKTRYKVPANCKEIGVPRVNPEIWSGLPQYVKTKDAKAQHLQQHFSKALIAQAKASEQILDLMAKTKDASLQGILQTVMDSAMSIGLGMKELNTTRKQDLKSSLLPEYTALASSQLPVTEYLFGDNLDANLKLLKSTSKIVKSQVPQSRYHPYGRNIKSTQYSRGNLNFRRQSSVRLPQSTGNFRPFQWRPNSPMIRPNQQSPNRFRKPPNQQRQ